MVKYHYIYIYRLKQVPLALSLAIFGSFYSLAGILQPHAYLFISSKYNL